MNIFTQTHLPKDGWIQGCFLCIRPTANTITYESKQKKRQYICAKIVKRKIQIPQRL